MGVLREQDRFLPIANVAKIMKKAIPDNAKVLFRVFLILQNLAIYTLMVFTLLFTLLF